jgi:hypothetical protein
MNRDLFKGVAPSISEPFRDAEVSRDEDGVFLDVWAENQYHNVPSPSPAPWLSCDLGEIRLDSVGLMLAATVIIGLVWMYFLSQSHLLTLLSWNSLYNSSSVRQGSTLLAGPIQAWRIMYGEQNTSWSATVARNCFILAALHKPYRWPVQRLENTLDHGGFPKLSPTRASVDVYQNSSSDTPLKTSLKHPRILSWVILGPPTKSIPPTMYCSRKTTSVLIFLFTLATAQYSMVTYHESPSCCSGAPVKVMQLPRTQQIRSSESDDTQPVVICCWITCLMLNGSR